MDGVTIIQTNVYRECSFPALLFCIIVISLACVAVIILFKILAGLSDSRVEKVKAFISAFIISAICMFGIADTIRQYNMIHTRYTVIIDDSVGFNEFYSKYKIIEQRGKHYIIEEIKE